MKQLSEEIDAKDDENMIAYQQYKKELIIKNKEMESMRQALNQYIEKGKVEATPDDRDNEMSNLQSTISMKDA